jgi:cytoplasmic iron level regulating protein YaaA (DUF328/UPF0246 family)
MAFLITCCKSKINPVVLNKSSLSKLSFDSILGESRNELLKLNPQIKLNWDYTLPAWQLYSGTRSKIYPQITYDNWLKGCVEIKILSALFGWVKHTDLLPIYNLRMSDRMISSSQRINKYWQNQNVLAQIVNETDIDLLSGDYRKAIDGTTNPVSIIPNVHFNDYGVQKGIWLNNQLNNVKCNH